MPMRVQASFQARLHGADWDALKLMGEQADAVVTRLADVPAAVARLRQDSAAGRD
jgi:hypothetical protein